MFRTILFICSTSNEGILFGCVSGGGVGPHGPRPPLTVGHGGPQERIGPAAAPLGGDQPRE